MEDGLMASLIKYECVVIEGELHICGDFCWCNSFFDEKTDLFLHHLTADKGRTVRRIIEVTQ